MVKYLLETSPADSGSTSQRNFLSPQASGDMCSQRPLLSCHCPRPAPPFAHRETKALFSDKAKRTSGQATSRPVDAVFSCVCPSQETAEPGAAVNGSCEVLEGHHFAGDRSKAREGSRGSRWVPYHSCSPRRVPEGSRASCLFSICPSHQWTSELVWLWDKICTGLAFCGFKKQDDSAWNVPETRRHQLRGAHTDLRQYQSVDDNALDF